MSNKICDASPSVESSVKEAKQDLTIFRSLSILDQILQFLTKATGETLITFENLESTLPSLVKVIPFEDFRSLVQFGILRVENLSGEREALGLQGNVDTEQESICNHCDSHLRRNKEWEEILVKHWDKPSSSSPSLHVGFPSGEANKKLCGSTKTAAKRRLAALKRCMKIKEKQCQQSKKQESSHLCQNKKDKLGYDENDYRNGIDGVRAPTKESETEKSELIAHDESGQSANKDWTLPSANDAEEVNTQDPMLKTEREARKAFREVLGLRYDSNGNASDPKCSWTESSRSGKLAKDDLYAPTSASASSFAPTPIINSILPRQLSYAGTQPAQTAQYECFTNENDNNTKNEDAERHPSILNLLHPIIARTFYLTDVRKSLKKDKQQRSLYTHQAMAISSALRDNKHTLVCTGTGSGKSLCFLIPVLQRALMGEKSLLLFPTKALAQDQLVKLQGLLDANPELAKHVSAAALDGDTAHSQRSLIAETCNVIFTNPDTLHASILPQWKNKYKKLLKGLKYVVVDEAHMYEGVFGAHVAMILARLYRVHCICSRLLDGGNCSDNYDSDDSAGGDINFRSNDDNDGQGLTQISLPSSPPSIIFLACSATLAHPEHHFRLLCCIPSHQPVTVLTEDFSPRAAKHFFVWNPPLLDENGKSLGYVVWPKTKKKKKKKGGDGENTKQSAAENNKENNVAQRRRREVRGGGGLGGAALLLAKAVAKGVRCIAFCKTRCLVEWVYERCIKTLKQSKETADLVTKVDSYRGGYSKLKRREIEEKLFHNQLLGVVGTSALELGVDIGGVGLTLHCGFPSSHASLMQQAGRAGRGAAASHQPSLAICVCFNSPIDQHLWRHPTSLLSRGLSAPLSMPIYPGLVQGHLIW